MADDKINNEADDDDDIIDYEGVDNEMGEIDESCNQCGCAINDNRQWDEKLGEVFARLLGVLHPSGYHEPWMCDEKCLRAAIEEARREVVDMYGTECACSKCGTKVDDSHISPCVMCRTFVCEKCVVRGEQAHAFCGEECLCGVDRPMLVYGGERSVLGYGWEGTGKEHMVFSRKLKDFIHEHQHDWDDNHYDMDSPINYDGSRRISTAFVNDGIGLCIAAHGYDPQAVIFFAFGAHGPYGGALDHKCYYQYGKDEDDAIRRLREAITKHQEEIDEAQQRQSEAMRQQEDAMRSQEE